MHDSKIHKIHKIIKYIGIHIDVTQIYKGNIKQVKYEMNLD